MFPHFLDVLFIESKYYVSILQYILHNGCIFHAVILLCII